MIPEFDVDAAADALRRAYPLEGCGLLLADGSFAACDNVAEDAERNFEIPRDFMVRHEGRVAAVVHCHWDGSGFSAVDRERQAAVGLPYVLLSFAGPDDDSPVVRRLPDA